MLTEELGHIELGAERECAGGSVEVAVLALAALPLAEPGAEGLDEELEHQVEQALHLVASYPSSVLAVYPPSLVLVCYSGPPYIPLLKSIIPPYPAYGNPALEDEKMIPKVINPIMLYVCLQKYNLSNF